MQGAPPLASPAFNRLRHLQTFSNMNPAGGLPGWSPANLATTVPGGGVLSLSPACPAFSLLPCPLSPRPFPNGEGEIYGYFMQGAPPLASPAFNRLRHLQSLPYRYPHGVAGFFNPDSRHPTGTNSPEKQGTRPLRASPTFGKPVPPGFSPRGCKGRSPLHKKTKNLPLPRRGRQITDKVYFQKR